MEIMLFSTLLRDQKRVRKMLFSTLLEAKLLSLANISTLVMLLRNALFMEGKMMSELMLVS